MMPDVFDEYAHGRPDLHPQIYVYQNPYDERFKGLYCVGDTTRENVEDRIKEEFKNAPFKQWDVLHVASAVREDGTSFRDHEVHRMLERKGYPAEPNYTGTSSEWFRCPLDVIKAAVIAVRDRTENAENRTGTFGMRPEQERAVRQTKEYFDNEISRGRTPKFLWNAKMRFGKTFAAYQLAKAENFRKILVLTFKPAVETAWEEDLLTHVDFEGWQFYSRDYAKKCGITDADLDLNRPLVCFGSFQDFLGVDKDGNIKPKNEWVHATNWDMVIFDEYHFGAWRENAKKIFEDTDDDSYDTLDLNKYAAEEADNAYNESFLHITTNCYLYLSGTPFRSLHNGEFIEEQIFSWTYSDEQDAKENWNEADGKNPYSALPRMVMMAYKLPDEIQKIAINTDTDEFDLNVFFSVKKGLPLEASEFVYKDEVQMWLNLIRGNYMPTTVDQYKTGLKPVMPFSDARMLSVLTHTVWFLPGVGACYAMRNLLAEKQNTFYQDYKVNVCAGADAGTGEKALGPVRSSMRDPMKSKTITLSCGKLMTGVTIRPWTGIFMLRNLSSPETYFQAAFRVQSPWTMENEYGESEIVKQECYIFDFALNRALRQISDYSCSLNITESNPEKKVGDFIRFLPVLAYDGSRMDPVNAADILDMTMWGTSATMLARKWDSALLVNVDNATLQRLRDNPEAMEALQQIEGFRSLNEDIQAIINKSEHVKNAKRDGKEKTEKEKKELTEEEKETKSKRKMIQEKLRKFATRIPIFMYLTDFRENTLKDVITQLEPRLFRKITGLTVKDFELLLSLGVFNDNEMNNAVYYFRRYEESSLEYAGINRHDDDRDVGLFSTTLTKREFDRMADEQLASMEGTSLVRLIERTVTGQAPTAPKTKPEPVIAAPAAPTQPPKPVSVTEPEPVMTKTPQPEEQKGAPTPVAGDRVMHKKFGSGMIIEVLKDSIVIKFDTGGEKKLGWPFSYDKGFITFI